MDDAGDWTALHRGRTVLVTGAGAGLGATLARHYAAAGARVMVNNRHRREGEPSAETVARSLRAQGWDATADLHAIDAPDAATGIRSALVARYGGLDTLVLNAGINGTASRIATMDPTEFAQVMAVNFTANVALVQALLPLLERSAAGRILFISSSAGLHGLYGRAHYAASKGAMNAFALTLAAELRRKGIGVNLLLPYADTAMTADVGAAVMARFSAGKVAPAALWLTSPRCTATGQMWIAGGGHFRRAMTVETRGTTVAAFGPQDGGAIAAAAADLEGLRPFTDGEAAFRDVLDAIGRG